MGPRPKAKLLNSDQVRRANMTQSREEHPAKKRAYEKRAASLS